PPLVAGGAGGERVLGRLERQLPLAEVAHLDDRAGLAPGEEGGEVLHRLLRRGETDELWAASHQRLQPFQRECQVAPPLVAGQGMDLVDDDRVRMAERLPTAD